MISEVVLEVAAEGGSIVVRRDAAHNGERFWIETNEIAIQELLSEEDQRDTSPAFGSNFVSSFAEALEQLDRYPWFQLSPLIVHQEYREAVLAAVRMRVDSRNHDESKGILKRWSAMAGGATSPAIPPRISDSSLILEVVNQTKAKEWVAERILYAERREAVLPSKEELWNQLVLALLTSQQRSTMGSAVDLFAQCEPFPLNLQNYEGMTDDEVRDVLKSFRFGRRVTEYLRINHETLFGKDGIWEDLHHVMEGLVLQQESEPTISSKTLERRAANLLCSLSGIGPKQSRNLLQELGLTRYEIPLDSRVTGWLGENLGWNIPISDLSEAEGYEFWLDRLQSVCEEAGVLPTVFDAAAFDVGKTMPSRKTLTTRTGYVSKNGQVVIRNTRLPGTDYLQRIYQLGCSHCGHVYVANGTDIFQRKCPVCQGGTTGIPFE